MPVLDTERTPRSALRYRPLAGDDQAQSQPGPIVARRSRLYPGMLSTSRPALPDDLDLEEEEHPPHPRRAAGATARRGTTSLAYVRRRFHPLFFVGVGLLVTILLWVGITQAMAWGGNELNNLKYGYPRTFQTDAVVGHNDSASHPSHFLAINLHGLVEVIEWPGGDSAHARIYTGPQLFGPDNDRQPITLRFAEVNGDHLPDMIIEVEGSQIIWINEQGSFRPLYPNK